jgi:hypothetical protein
MVPLLPCRSSKTGRQRLMYGWMRCDEWVVVIVIETIILYNQVGCTTASASMLSVPMVAENRRWRHRGIRCCRLNDRRHHNFGRFKLAFDIAH